MTKEDTRLSPNSKQLIGDMMSDDVGVLTMQLHNSVRPQGHIWITSLYSNN